MMADSVGPATTSMPMRPNSVRLASATKRLPGPTITSAGLAEYRPKAMAATPCTPPRLSTVSAPHSFMVCRMAGFTPDSLCAGDVATMSGTPATLAVHTLMIAEAACA